MKGFLFIVSKRGAIDVEPNDLFQSIDYLKECDHTYDHYIYDDLLGISYTNEPKKEQAFHRQYFFAYSGQLTTSFDKVKNDIMKYNPNKVKNYVKDLSGAFAIAFAHVPSKTVRAYTHFARVNPIYYFEDANKIVLGTDPLIVHTAAYDTVVPVLKVQQSISFLMNGYYTDNNTLFEGVKAVPENTEVLIEKNSLSFIDIDDSVSNMFQKNATKEDYDELTELYLRAYDVVPQSDKPYTIGLTGGKDSRLIALGLIEKGIPFHAITRGFNDHPDVIIAQELAKRLNVSHKVNSPVVNRENELEMDLIGKILKTMHGTSGNVFGYENINYNPVFQDRIGLTGVGAECVRGGYGNHSRKNPNSITNELVKSFLNLREYITPGNETGYEQFLREFGKNETSFKEAQCKHYIFYRVGRWAGGTRNSILYTANMYSPFFDNQFLKKATQLNINTLVGEEVHYNIMKRLNPKIAEMSFFASRWGFESKGPKNPNDYRNWFKRNPTYAKTQLGAYNWRALNNEEPVLRNAFKNILLSNPNDEIFDVVNYNKIAEILNNPVPIALNKFIWSLASIKVYKDHFAGQVNYGFSSIKLKIPGGEIKHIDNFPQVKDLTSILQPINKAIVQKKNKQGFHLTLNKEGKGNLYIQTADSAFKSPPLLNRELLNVQGKKKLYVRFCLESELETDYDLYIMFYDETSRISSDVVKKKYKNKRIYIEKNILIPPHSKHVKFALNFKPKKEKIDIDIKYGYMELI